MKKKTEPTVKGLENRKGAGGFAGFAFSRTIGVKHWCCPVCNQVNRTTVRPQTYAIKCGNKGCGASWTIGEVFYERPTGHVVPPPDTILPTARHGNRAPINRVYCSGCAKLMYSEGFKRPMTEKPEGFNVGFYDEGIEGLYEPRPWEEITSVDKYGKGMRNLKKRGYEREYLNEELC